MTAHKRAHKTAHKNPRALGSVMAARRRRGPCRAVPGVWGAGSGRASSRCHGNGRRRLTCDGGGWRGVAGAPRGLAAGAPPAGVVVGGAVGGGWGGGGGGGGGFFVGREGATGRVGGGMWGPRGGGGLLVGSGGWGAGKSSLLRAGVLPRIRADGLAAAPGAASWPCVLFTPTPAPLDELALRVAPLAGAGAAAGGRGPATQPGPVARRPPPSAPAGRPAPRRRP